MAEPDSSTIAMTLGLDVVETLLALAKRAPLGLKAADRARRAAVVRMVENEIEVVRRLARG